MKQVQLLMLRRTCETAPGLPHPRYGDVSPLADRGKDAVKDLSVKISSE